MKNSDIRLVILFLFLAISLFQCNNDGADNTALTHDRFLLPSKSGDYEPSGLRKLSILEMKKLGESDGVPSNIVWKDQRGNIVSPDYYGNGSDARFVQFYANSTGKVEEAVVFEMTPEIKSIMMLMRIATMPVDY